MHLDQIEQLSEEQQSVLDSILAFPDQCFHAWELAKNVRFRRSYEDQQSIIVGGMGGSALGPRLIKSTFQQSLKASIEVVSGYHLPAYANQETLFVASSYSGNTEETILLAQQAHKAGCKVVVIAAGGKLMDWAQSLDLPYLEIVPTHNASGQPRLATGYSVFALVGILSQLGYLSITDEEVKALLVQLLQRKSEWDLSSAVSVNTAKRIAQELKGNIPLFVSSDHLTANASISINLLNETSKSLAMAFSLPELNHHLLEGLKNPELAKNTIFIFFQSGDYSVQLQKRYDVTKEVVEQNKLSHMMYLAVGETKLQQSCELLFLASLISFYLSLLYNENPLAIPWVTHFKKQLG